MMDQELKDRQARAVALKHSGHNCCQAVLLAYADRLPLSEAVMDNLGLPFGSGMGTGEGTCGALCGAEMAAGLLGLGTAGNFQTVRRRHRGQRVPGFKGNRDRPAPVQLRRLRASGGDGTGGRFERCRGCAAGFPPD